GVLPASDLSERYRRARVLLTASRYEGRPMAVTEAMASGVAVCGTDIPGHRELVRPGREGLLAPAGDAEELASSLSALLEDRELAAALGRAARRRAMTWPAWEETVARFADVVERAVHDTVAR